MFLLDKKSHGLVMYLLQLKEPETVMAIAKALEQSRRKIYYHLEKINDALPKEVPQIVAYPRVGIMLNEEQKMACRELLSEVDDYSYIMSRKERIWLIMSFIALSQERVTIEKIMALTDVSRNTILNDLNDVRQYLADEPFQISLMVTRSRGYYFDCHPMNKFRFYYSLAQTLFSDDYQQLIAVLECKEESFLALDTYFSKDVLAYLESFFTTIQINTGKKINQQDRNFVVKNLPNFLLNYRNMELTQATREMVKSDFLPIQKRIEYTVAKNLGDQLKQKFDFALDEIEIGMIATLLLSFRKDRDTHLESPDYQEMRSVLARFLDYLTEEKGLQFTKREDLLRQLLTHSKALMYRKHYGIGTLNKLLPYLKEKYSGLFEATLEAVSILEEAWDIHLTEDDIGFLTVHLGGALLVQREKRREPKALILCDDSVAVQKFLLTQCREYLPNVTFEAIFTSEQFQSVRDLVSVDFIVSTLDQVDTHIPVVTIHAVLSDTDIMRLTRYSHYGAGFDYSRFREDIVKVLGQHIKEEQELQGVALQIEKLIHRELLYDYQDSTK